MKRKYIVEYRVQLKRVRKIFCKNTKINSSIDIIKIIKKFYHYDDREKLYVILVNSRRKIMGINLVSIGTIDGLIIHPREVFKPAILLGASAIIMVHNHPSGDAVPSESDRKNTDIIIESGNILGIPLIDHIIYSEKKYYSMYEKRGIRWKI